MISATNMTLIKENTARVSDLQQVSSSIYVHFCNKKCQNKTKNEIPACSWTY